MSIFGLFCRPPPGLFFDQLSMFLRTILMCFDMLMLRRRFCPKSQSDAQFSCPCGFFDPLSTFLGTISVSLNTLMPKLRFRPKSQSVARFLVYHGVFRALSTFLGTISLYCLMLMSLCRFTRNLSAPTAREDTKKTMFLKKRSHGFAVPVTSNPLVQLWVSCQRTVLPAHCFSAAFGMRTIIFLLWFPPVR